MTVRNLNYLFHPKSVAIIGASNKPHGVGTTVLENVVHAGFHGDIYPVNPKYETLCGLKTYPDIASLPGAPDLAVICTPPASVPGLISQLGERGTRAVIVLTAGLSAHRDWRGRTMKELMLAAAKPYLLRILGPNCVGMLVPGIGLNASFAHINALPGKIAFVSQSGAMVTGVLDWARSRNIGFSKFVSLGDSVDVDFGDVIDYLASDPDTQAILLYIEAVSSARKFMSAARAAARSKPTLVIKAGRVAEGAKAATSHTGALAGADDVYDAAIRRAGMLRVYSTEELFDAVETLARLRPLSGERLAILTNGGGPGVMATDTLVCSGGKLASLSAATLDRLHAVLPSNWSKANPIDIVGDAPPERYTQALQILLADKEVDATLFIHAPTAIVPSLDIATTLAPIIKQSYPNVLACWLGGDSVAAARRIFTDIGVPTYDTPEKAIGAFMQMVRYRRNQQLLMEVPSAISRTHLEDKKRARAIIEQVIADGRELLSEWEAKQVLAAYGIPIVETRTVNDPAAAGREAQDVGFPVALKILSPDITHKSDVGGVVLDLESAEAVAEAAERMHARLRELYPHARLAGFTVQAMARRPEGRELIVGVATDPVFGPVILFGQGGIAVEVTADRAIALPPLNGVLARELISRTRIARLLGAYRNRRAADINAICRTLVQVSDMVIDLPELQELDINPLFADADGVIALDARICVKPVKDNGLEQLAIRPYPAELEEWVQWQSAELLLRPIRPEDGAAHLAFFNALDPEDVRYRMFIRMRELSPSQLARLTQIDYDREMAFIATRRLDTGAWETLGVARVVADPDNVEAEFAVIVRSDLKGQGLGYALMKKLIAYCSDRGTQRIVGEALSYNHGILNMASNLGFEVSPSTEGGTMIMKLELKPQ
ncbi:bifunctional acetate--CoA ligase family protein/GNAT family N-acetyltransferase [Noviherbaspirillum sp. CPCC 100848]|uniref:Bifunctional acetate--CoA ligase family protein/GNAT family N-acetyltransferase n=1 Tax=Noviherbaspirillum album TaxID=3080276 RepID=A0ABU6JIR2_9BURK|nr:bifunctional acetate--CoA ligase family protein/GNAT family N-acetyltransferase [Noviherbaspirillum sp. CPCC 100848]MEC4723590.1 bifunctional acetate--CoA ligase family protein/GNAT family N-acetyltransferase [Noviherbaspirillum sp. CPCC 100848]